jgi:hypothetical protein
MLLLGTLLLGGSAGPLITGWYATETHLAPVLVSAGMLGFGWLFAVQIAAVLGRRAHPGDAIPAPLLPGAPK